MLVKFWSGLLELDEVGAITIEAFAESTGATLLYHFNSFLQVANFSVGIGSATGEIGSLGEFGGFAIQKDAGLVEGFRCTESSFISTYRFCPSLLFKV